LLRDSFHELCHHDRACQYLYYKPVYESETVPKASS